MRGIDIAGPYNNMVYSQWLRSLRKGNDYFKLIDSKVYYDVYHRYVSNILARETTVVRFAALTDDPDTVLGFSVSAGSVLHYVFTQPMNRMQGIATTLVPFEVETITHLTKTGLSIWNSKLPKAIFNPFT
jgi:citrate lyase synthetase